MKKAIITVAMTSVLMLPNLSQAQTTLEQPTHKETLIGLSTGAVVGGLVGGPIGAFVGAFAGGLMGEKEVTKQQLADQQDAILVMQQKTADYQQVLADNSHLTAQLEAMANENEALSQAQLNNLLAMNVQFKTGSSDIAPHFAKQLNKLAQLLKSQPNLAVDLSGFADQRGDELANLMLSKQRVNAVQSYLIKQGVPHTRLTATAFGEQQTIAQSDTYEENVFDRRVTLSTRPVTGKLQHTARNQQ